MSNNIIYTDNTPYLSRKTGNGNITVNSTNRCYDTLIGATVNVNQLVPISASSRSVTSNGLTFVDNRDGSYTFYTAEGGTTSLVTCPIVSEVDVILPQRVYLVSGSAEGSSSTTWYLSDGYNGVLTYGYKKEYLNKIARSTPARLDLRLIVRQGVVITSPITIKPQVIDLTAMFGSTIADYLYSIETATEGAGIAKLREWGFLRGYQAFNAGSIESVEVTGKKVVGFNLFNKDEAVEGVYIRDSNGTEGATQGAISTGWIPVIGGEDYFIVNTATSGRWGAWYDADKIFISACVGDGVKTAPLNAGYMRMTIKSAEDSLGSVDTFCINLSSDRNGEYEPYSAHTYDLGTDTLRGLFKLDSNNELYADGDTKTSDGTVTRRYGVVDLGTLNWTYYNYGIFYTQSLTQAKPYSGNIICEKYTTEPVPLTNPTDKTIYMAASGSQPILRICDTAYTDETAFKNSLSNVMLVYKKQTPTTETSTPFQNPQICDPDGTEEYITETGVPVGHETEYFVGESEIVEPTIGHVLDYNGLSYFWQRIKNRFDSKLGNAKMFTGTCSTAAATTEKAVICPEFTNADLIKGTQISVFFSNTNTGARGSLTLNVNSTGAKSIKYIYNGSYDNIPGNGYLKANQIYTFTYDGTYWVVDMMYNSNTMPDYLNYRNNTYAKKAIAANRWIVGDKDGYEEIASGVTFDLSYPILYTTGAISQGSNNYANMLMQDYDLNLGNLKSGFTSSAKKMIYLVVTISGNTATVDSSIITDTLPTSDDGKAYITLGRLGNQSSGANYFLFQAVHPIFVYRKGQIRLYSGSADVVNGHTVEADVPSGAVFTDSKVTQTLYSQNYDLPLLMSYFANTNTGASGTNIALRNNSIYANPSTGLLTATALKSNNYLQVQNKGVNVASSYSGSYIDEIILYTGIKFVSSNLMPLVHITGYAYGTSEPIDLNIVFYIYNDKFCNQGVINNGGWHPNVYLFKYTKNSENYVAIALRYSSYIYYPTVNADVLNESLGKLTNIDLSLFEFRFTAKDATSVIPEPDNGVTCIQVPYKVNYNPKPALTIQGNSSTIGTYDGTNTATVNITKSSIGLGNVENKSSATIRGELTSSNVTTALGYTPVNKAGDTMTGNLLFDQLVRGSIFPAHYYHRLYNDTDGTVYVHYYQAGTSFTNTKAELRVKSDGGYKCLVFNGNGNFTWDGYPVLHSNNYTDYTIPKTGGTLTGDLILQVSSGNSPAIIFQRGTYTDSLNDWEIRDKGGLLYFGQRGLDSTAFDTSIYLDNSGGIHASTFFGSLTGHASLDLPLTAGSSASLSNSLYITRAGECGVEVNNTQATNPNQVAFIVGSSGNGGIYSRKHNKWIVYANASGDVVLNGNATSATTATTATIATYLNIVAGNELRFASKPSSAVTLHVGYKWHDGTSDAKINRYKFCNGNAALAEVEASTFYGSLSGNATTANEAKALITLGDKRSVATTPNDYTNKIVFAGLKNKATVNNPSNDTYSYVVGLRGWSDSSGGKAHEFAFNDSGIFTRMGSTTEWDSWRKIMDDKNWRDVITSSSSSTLPLNQGDLSPIQSKIYTGVIGTANNWSGAVFFFGSIKPISWNTLWEITYRIRTYVPNKDQYDMVADVMMSGTQNAIKNWYSNNTVGAYYPAYYHELYRMKQAGLTNGYGHALGVRFQSAYSPTDANYKRTIVVDILETKNCEFTFYDSCLPYASIPGTGSTNYDSYTEINYCSNGLQEQSDANDPNYYNREYYASRTTVDALYRYQLCMTKPDGSLVPINTVSNSVATDKVLTTNTFDPFGEIFYYATTGTCEANANVGNGNLYRQYVADLRYSFNCGGYDTTPTLTARNPLYLVVVPQSDGLATLHSTPLSESLPTSDDGLLYIYLGRVYEDTKPYRVTLSINHPIYKFTGNSAREISSNITNNLVDGSAIGSVRSVGSDNESSAYTIGINAFAEGSSTRASGNASHAEGATTTASNYGSHSEGLSTTASGEASHAQNYGTKASSDYQTALGKYNIEDINDVYAVIIGNGTANNARSNALTIDWNGNVSIGNNSKTLTYSIRTYNSLHDINLNANTSGNAGIWDSTTNSWMIYNDINGKTYLGNTTQIYTDGSSLRSNTFYTNYNIYCGSAIGTGGRTSYTDVSKSGDWISSDGVIDLVRSNTSGGLIQFHYNYSSSVTSTIEEVNSGVIHISGTLTAGQAIRSNASSTDYCKLNGHTAMVVGREESRIGAFISRGSSTEDLANNNIYLYANSQGRVGIYSIMQEDATAVTILSRENNSNTITFGNRAGNVLTYSYNYSSAPPIVSNTAANHRVSHFYMSTATQLMVHAQGNASSYAAYYISTSSSDIRLKENICDTKVSALPVINSFKLREFDWKNGDGHQKIGMIADEVEKIDPKLTVGGGYDENGEMNIKTIDTFYLIGYLTKAVQELSAEIEELKKS